MYSMPTSQCYPAAMPKTFTSTNSVPDKKQKKARKQAEFSLDAMQEKLCCDVMPMDIPAAKM
jgi:hypothetical protein